MNNWIRIDYTNTNLPCFDGKEYLFTWNGANYHVSHWTGDYFAFGNGYHRGDQPFTHYAEFNRLHG